jgi:inner membrane protein
LYTLPLLIGWIIALIASSTSSFAHLSVRYALVLSSIYLLWSFIAKWHIDTLNHSAFAANGIQSEVYVSTPAPLSTFLWRSVAIDDGQYYEVFTSVFDQSDEVSLNRYSQNDELLDDIASEWGVQRLKWFTKGAYGVKQEGDDILITDLRMGDRAKLCVYL